MQHDQALKKEKPKHTKTVAEGHLCYMKETTYFINPFVSNIQQEKLGDRKISGCQRPGSWMKKVGSE